MRCFCGCGQQVPWLSPPLWLANWRGRRIAKDVGRIDELLGRGLQSPEAVSFVREGNALLVQLGEGVHTRTDPGPAVNRDCRRFMRRARERFRAARIRRGARRAGLDENQAAAAIASGRWDPFAD